MADISAAVLPVSNDRTANALTHPFFTQITDGTTGATVDAGTGGLKVFIANTTIAVTQSGTWNINNISGTVSLPTGAATEVTLAKLTLAQGSTTSGQTNALIAGAVTTGAPSYTTAQTSPLSLDTTGNLRVAFSGTMTVTGTVTANQGTAAVTANAWPIKITDGTRTATLTASNNVPINIAEQSLTALVISRTTAANSETNPIFVQMTSGATSGDEVNDYNTAAAVASAATNNHDYTVTGATMLLKSVQASASGAIKVEVKTGPVASLVSKAVAFSSSANPNIALWFDPPIEVPVASTGTVRVARTNREAVAQDVYSTILGSNI